MSRLLPREWMDPAKRPPKDYLLPWQQMMLDIYDYLQQQQDLQLANLFNHDFHEPVRNPHVPHSLTAFKTILRFSTASSRMEESPQEAEEDESVGEGFA